MKDFYETTAARGVSPGRQSALADLAARHLAAHARAPFRILDLGCGTGETLLGVVAELERRDLLARGGAELHGWDLAEAPLVPAAARGLHTRTFDVSTQDAPADLAGTFDLVIFSEVLEHLVDTGRALRTVAALLKPGGAAVITTPNLAAWYNRVLLLFGYQPHMTEVSFEPCRFGNPLFYKLLGETPGQVPMAGHLRVFTLRALKELVAYCGLEVRAVLGVSSHGDLVSRVVSRVWPGGAGDLGVLAVRPAQPPTPSPAAAG